MAAQRIIDLASKRIVSITADGTMRAAVKLLSDHRIGLLIVHAGEDDIAGVLSERDVVRALARFDAEALMRSVSDFMTRSVATCNSDAHPHDVLAEMYRLNIRHMPVVDGSKLRGIVSLRDILRHLTQNTTPDEQAMMWAKLVHIR